MIHYVVLFVFFLGALRINSIWERRLESRRRLHGMVLPLYHYLKLYKQDEENALFQQAVLDHVTELRSYLLQPISRDLCFFGIGLSWTIHLNNILLGLEETLEAEGQKLDQVQLQAQVDHLLEFIKKNSLLLKLTQKSLGVVEYTNG